MLRTCRYLATLLTALALSLGPSSVHARGGGSAAAARAFANGQSAQMQEDHGLAAEQFELADSILPSAAALRSAARARLQAGDLPKAASHAEALLRRYPSDPSATGLASDILARTQPKLLRVTASCTPECTISSDSRAVVLTPAKSHVFYLRPGDHAITADFFDGGSADRLTQGAAGESVEVDLEAPESAAQGAEQALPVPSAEQGGPNTNVDLRNRSRRKAHPAIALTTAGLTLGLGGVLLWSALDTRDAHSKFETSPTQARLDVGQRKQLRTNVLIGLTASMGIATAVVAAIATDWGRLRKSSSTAKLRFAPTGIQGRF